MHQKCTQGTMRTPLRSHEVYANKLPTSKKKKKSWCWLTKSWYPKRLRKFFQHHSGAYTTSVRRSVRRGVHKSVRVHQRCTQGTWSVRMHQKCTQGTQRTPLRSHKVYARYQKPVTKTEKKKIFVLTSKKCWYPKRLRKFFQHHSEKCTQRCTQKCTRTPKVYARYLKCTQSTRSVRKVPSVHICGHKKCTQGTKNKLPKPKKKKFVLTNKMPIPKKIYKIFSTPIVERTPEVYARYQKCTQGTWSVRMHQSVRKVPEVYAYTRSVRKVPCWLTQTFFFPTW